MKSPLSHNSAVKTIYTQRLLPLFQNKVYPTREEAFTVKKTAVKLVQCQDTGFVFSGDFDINRLEYDQNYQNEQSNSSVFQTHLNNVIEFLKTENTLNGTILEIGCGKGYFMDLLVAQGYDVTGIDPTYEGEDPKIIKDYYGEKYHYLNADLIILRHTLEHLPDPLGFLQMIAKANGYRGKIYVEIPTFEWIVKNHAVEDIFYEHCNYFTARTAALLFTSSHITHTFNNQYLSILADLADIRQMVSPENQIERHDLHFDETLLRYEELIPENKRCAIWGAGAKGSTFLNLLSNSKHIHCVVDINPKKQGKYIGGTGHPIVAPNQLADYQIEHIIVMNHNYLEEIQQLVNSESISYSVLAL